MKISRPEGMKRNAGILAGAGTMGLHLVSGPAVGFIIGYFLDDWLGTHPWMKAVFFLLGVISGFKLVYEDARKIARETENPRDQGDQGTDPPA
jgi:ATP synthase protein I